MVVEKTHIVLDHVQNGPGYLEELLEVCEGTMNGVYGFFVKKRSGLKHITPEQFNNMKTRIEYKYFNK